MIWIPKTSVVGIGGFGHSEERGQLFIPRVVLIKTARVLTGRTGTKLRAKTWSKVSNPVMQADRDYMLALVAVKCHFKSRPLIE